ncbi:MAG: hypothetical protein A2X78_01225 [Gammaproteobacteria bacterium GWE2_37_16]|nr:MAG: hypothetical protein A2X78_01225 [Gammaproteobacteria bacterium GWE2_37_16]
MLFDNPIYAVLMRRKFEAEQEREKLKSGIAGTELKEIGKNKEVKEVNDVEHTQNCGLQQMMRQAVPTVEQENSSFGMRWRASF